MAIEPERFEPDGGANVPLMSVTVRMAAVVLASAADCDAPDASYRKNDRLIVMPLAVMAGHANAFDVDE